MDLTGKRLKSFKPHMASIVDVVVDPLGEFIGTASIDGGSVGSVHNHRCLTSAQGRLLSIP